MKVKTKTPQGTQNSSGYGLTSIFITWPSLSQGAERLHDGLSGTSLQIYTGGTGMVTFNMFPITNSFHREALLKRHSMDFMLPHSTTKKSWSQFRGDSVPRQNLHPWLESEDNAANEGSS